MPYEDIPERCPTCGSVPVFLPRICEGCGEEFLAARNQLKLGRARFCSRRCLGIWRRKPRVDVEERFWAKVVKTDSCWIWTAGKTVGGYGSFRIRHPRTKTLAHRIAYELTYGSIPDGLFVCHRCDNPPCVRPDHLFLGSSAENTADAKTKGRITGRPRGTTLSAEAARAIRRAHTLGHSQARLARAYGVDRLTIRNVLIGKTWKTT